MSYSELKKKKKVMVAMSGGVDSSVAAYLLKKEGFKVSGVTMCLGVKDGPMYNPRCCGSQSINDAKNVCLKLGIVHYVLDLSDEMEKFIIRPFTVQYLSGKTPNPCVDCNRYLKFGVLMDRATATGFDY
ncbi:MAG: tRNA 2-thiouridine(34) synthase MnmA, partial [Actinobacteria bacterium]|nr:tRNA 2-thiouridine(34) synthase MnmA [Actinomycetota bacterium]